VSSEDETSQPESTEAGKGGKEPKALAASDAPESDERMDLPKWNRARVKRKAPKGTEQDAFQGAVRGAGKKAIRSAPLVLGLAAVVAGLIAGTIWWMGQRTETRAESTRVLAEAVAYRARGRVADVETLMQDRRRPFPRPIASDEAELAAKVREGLDAVESQAPDSAAARMALIVRGAKKVEAREFAEAEAAFREFLDRHGPRHELAYLAQEGLLAALEGQSDLEGALAQAEAMSGSEGDFYRDQALWHRARLLEKLERSDEALEVYRQYAQEYPLDKSSFAWQQVRRRLSELDPGAVPSASPVSPSAGDFLLP
jgi:tetratricopeptide (TPR) repeat protein